MSATKRADEIEAGDVIRVAVNGTAGEWEVVRTEVSDHGDHALELSDETVVIAEAWDLFTVTDRDEQDAADAVTR